MNATPTRTLVWPGGELGDEMDIVNGTVHLPSGGESSAATGARAFVDLCRSIRCQAIFQVPGEIDSPATAANVVRFVEHDLGFSPMAWEVGNEPGRWTHFGQPWSTWGRSSTTPPSPQQYADLVHQYLAAMRAVDPTVRMIGLPGTGHGSYQEASWIAATVQENGPNLSGVAIHVYPAGLGPPSPSGASLAQFFGTLEDKASLPVRVPLDEAAIRSACPSCSPIPIYVTELGSAITAGYDGPFVSGYDQAPYIVAEVAQAIHLDLAQLDYFAVEHSSDGSWFTSPEASHPIYQLYAELLSRLGSEVLPTNVSTSVGGIYAIATAGATPTTPIDLLVDNVNSTDSIAFPTASTGLDASGPIETWSWNGSTSGPTTTYWPHGLPSSWTVDPASLVLFEQPRTVSAPLTVSESGFPSGQRWFLRVGNVTATTNGSRLTYLLPTGSYPQTTHGARNISSGVREEFTFADRVALGASPTTENGSYGFEYLVTTLPSTSAGGSTAPASQWVFQGGVENVTATAAVGYRFAGWKGSGPGSYSGSADPATVRPSGAVAEVAEFVTASPSSYPVELIESGLPNGTLWGAHLGNQSLSGVDPALRAQLPNGTYSFAIEPVNGFVGQPSNGSVQVMGGPVTEPISFRPIPPGEHSVWFNETGLTPGSTWTVVLNGTEGSSDEASLRFIEPAGTYAYTIARIGSWSPDPDRGTLTVPAGTDSVAVHFVFGYLLMIEAPAGTPSDREWNVTLDPVGTGGTAVGPPVPVQGSSINASISFEEPNGTYNYSVTVDGFPQYHGTGSVTVSGGTASVSPPPLAQSPSASGSAEDLIYLGVAIGTIALVAVGLGYYLPRRRSRR